MADKTINELLVDALHGGDPDGVADLIKAGADIRYQKDNGYDALIDAVHGRDILHDALLIEMLQLLIENGVSVQGESKWHESGARALSFVGRFDAVQLLLKAGANPDFVQFTPLMQAVAFGTATNVASALENEVDLEKADSWWRTAWHIALQTGEIPKAKLLMDSGANIHARGNCDQPPLFYAVENGHISMLQWLLEIGMDLGDTNEFGWTTLSTAASHGQAEAVGVLIDAGADVNQKFKTETALSNAFSRDIALMLLNAGADPDELSERGRRAILGFSPEPDTGLLIASMQDYLEDRAPKFGTQNPEVMTNPFWVGMIRSGLTAYAANAHYGNEFPEDSEYEPTWCDARFGRSMTFLPDGRIVEIGGEHEDYYDEDFSIYNDVFVYGSSGEITIYGYPEAIFPPTDFHTATLVGESIYIIGSVGYTGERWYGVTPVYRLNLQTFSIERLETTGQNPGWISRHRSKLISDYEMEITGGKVMVQGEGKDAYLDNGVKFVLDVKPLVWREINRPTK